MLHRTSSKCLYVFQSITLGYLLKSSWVTTPIVIQPMPTYSWISFPIITMLGNSGELAVDIRCKSANLMVLHFDVSTWVTEVFLHVKTSCIPKFTLYDDFITFEIHPMPNERNLLCVTNVFASMFTKNQSRLNPPNTKSRSPIHTYAHHLANGMVVVYYHLFRPLTVVLPWCRLALFVLRIMRIFLPQALR